MSSGFRPSWAYIQESGRAVSTQDFDLKQFAHKLTLSSNIEMAIWKVSGSHWKEIHGLFLGWVVEGQGTVGIYSGHRSACGCFLKLSFHLAGPAWADTICDTLHQTFPIKLASTIHSPNLVFLSANLTNLLALISASTKQSTCHLTQWMTSDGTGTPLKRASPLTPAHPQQSWQGLPDSGWGTSPNHYHICSQCCLWLMLAIHQYACSNFNLITTGGHLKSTQGTPLNHLTLVTRENLYGTTKTLNSKAVLRKKKKIRAIMHLSFKLYDKV